MKQEVQDFLNLPGIAGVALMDGRSRPYFCGVDQTLNFQQKEALAQGILQVVETIPEGFESFEFQFTGHQVYIYKLDHGIILLVLTRNDLVYADYLRTIKKLQVALQEDIVNAIATFRLIAGNITLSGLNYRKNSSENTSTSRSVSGATIAGNPGLEKNFRPPSPAANESELSGSYPLADSPSQIPESVESQPHAITSSENTMSGNAIVPQPEAEVSLKDLIGALNQLSQFTTQYLGTAVIVNYWKSTRPHVDWLEHFQIDRAAQFSYIGGKTNQLVSAQEQQWLQEWVETFIKRCSQIIRDFPTIVTQKGLDDRQKALLLTNPTLL